MRVEREPSVGAARNLGCSEAGRTGKQSIKGE